MLWYASVSKASSHCGKSTVQSALFPQHKSIPINYLHWFQSSRHAIAGLHTWAIPPICLPSLGNGNGHPASSPGCWRSSSTRCQSVWSCADKRCAAASTCRALDRAPLHLPVQAPTLYNNWEFTGWYPFCRRAVCIHIVFVHSPVHSINNIGVIIFAIIPVPVAMSIWLRQFIIKFRFNALYHMIITYCNLNVILKWVDYSSHVNWKFYRVCPAEVWHKVTLYWLTTFCYFFDKILFLHAVQTNFDVRIKMSLNSMNDSYFITSVHDSLNHVNNTEVKLVRTYCFIL